MTAAKKVTIQKQTQDKATAIFLFGQSLKRLTKLVFKPSLTN